MVRTAGIERVTNETTIRLQLNLDGTGTAAIKTGVGFLDHMLELLTKHGVIDLEVQATGDLHVDQHHTVEDVSIGVGRAINEAIGDGRGIVRMGHALVPFDETLAQVAVDLSGRAYAIVETAIYGEMVESLPSDLIRHSLESIAM